jgi:N-acetyl-gamma-glutamylphosphate reductase
MVRASIIGGSGYTGGELLRLLLAHPGVEVAQVTSRKHLGEYAYQVHPNLRKQTALKFSDPDTVQECDVLFLALPHGQAQHKIEDYSRLAPNIVDLSADFRLRRPGDYELVWPITQHLNGWTVSSTGCQSCTARRYGQLTMSAGWDATPRLLSWRCFHWCEPDCSTATGGDC